ncbi:MAG: hypothetical protein AAGE18_11300 [Pseudomonadota bacterium]
MTRTIVKSVGAAPGRDFPTLAAFANAVPSDLVAADERWVGELYDDGPDPGGVVLNVTADATRRVVLRAAPVAGFRDRLDPVATALHPDAVHGAMIDAPSGAAITLAGASTVVEIRGLQIRTQDDAAIDARFSDDCLFEDLLVDVNGAEAGVLATGAGTRIAGLALTHVGTGDGLLVSEGVEVVRSTILRPTLTLAPAQGIAVAGGQVTLRDVAVFGFARAFPEPAEVAAAEGLVADQSNLLAMPHNFAAPEWSLDEDLEILAPVGLTTSDGVPLSLVTTGADNWSYATYTGAIEIPPGEALLLQIDVRPDELSRLNLRFDEGGLQNRMRVDVKKDPPVLQNVILESPFTELPTQIDPLGDGVWRIRGGAVNADSVAHTVSLRLALKSLVKQVPGEAMIGGFAAGVGYLATQPVPRDHVDVGAGVDGVDPEAALVDATAGDLRAAAGGPLIGAGSGARADMFGDWPGDPAAASAGAHQDDPAARAAAEDLTSAQLMSVAVPLNGGFAQDLWRAQHLSTPRGYAQEPRETTLLRATDIPVSWRDYLIPAERRS